MKKGILRKKYAFIFFIAQKLKLGNVGSRIIKFDTHTIYGNVKRYIE